jgi:hypothetical protein
MRPATLVGGVAVILLGAWILLDAAEVLRLSFGGLAAALAMALGAVLLAAGLEDAERPGT